MERKRLTRKYVDDVSTTSITTSTSGTYTVALSGVGKNKIEVIKAIREFGGLELCEAKSIVDNCPQVIKRNISETEAQKIKMNIERYGAELSVYNN